MSPFYDDSMVAVEVVVTEAPFGCCCQLVTGLR